MQSFGRDSYYGKAGEVSWQLSWQRLAACALRNSISRNPMLDITRNCFIISLKVKDNCDSNDYSQSGLEAVLSKCEDRYRDSDLV